MVYQYIMRNSNVYDFDNIMDLLTSLKAKCFGRFKAKNIDPYLFYKSYATHQIVMNKENEGDTLLGYAEFQNYPAISALPRDCWREYLERHFCIPLQLSPANVLFFNYFLFTRALLPDILHAILYEIFFRERKVRYIITVQMPDQWYKRQEEKPHYYFLDDFSTIYYPRDFSVSGSKNVARVHIIYRDYIVPKMEYRGALPEDNDDIVELIDFDYPELRADLGDFYIAEELLNDDDRSNMLIVAEINHLTIGFIWVNGAVDALKIAKNFDVEIYGNLVKCSPDKPQLYFTVPVHLSKKKSSSKMFTAAAIQGLFDPTAMSKFRIKGDGSGNTVYSRHKENVSSQSDSINTSDESLFLLEETFNKYAKINEQMTSNRYYTITVKKNLTIYYNVPEKNDSETHQAHTPSDVSSNVFALQLIGFHGSRDLRRVYRLLLASFSAYPDRDYCIFSMPPGKQTSPSIYELLTFFQPIMPRPNCSIFDHVYITHRSAIYGELSIHEIRPKDLEDINYILESNLQWDKKQEAESFTLTSSTISKSKIKHVRMVQDIIAKVLENPFSDIRVLTIRCGNAARSIEDNIIVGFVVIRPMPFIEPLRENFKLPHIEEHMNTKRAEIISFRLHALYHFESDAVFREIARATGYYIFFYMQPTRSVLKPFENDLCQQMQPIEPHRIKRCKERLKGKNRSPPVTPKNSAYSAHSRYSNNHKSIQFKQKFGPPSMNLSADNFALFQHNLMSSKQFGNKEPIIVVGFGDLAKAFLRLMVFSWMTPDCKNMKAYCCLPRLAITVIAPPGHIEAEYDNDFTCSICQDPGDCWINYANHNSFIRDTVKRIDLRKWINFVGGYVKFIDKKRKSLLLDNNCELFYDKLLLLCDTDFGLPKPLHSIDDLPPNYAHINGRFDKIMLYHKLNLIKNKENPAEILVYGAHIATFEFINFLITHGVNPKNITLVMPYWLAEKDITAQLNNPEWDANIEVILQEMVTDLGVTVYENLNFSHWKRYHQNDNICAVVFEHLHSDDDIEIKCDFLISFHEVNTDLSFAQTMQDSGIRMIHRSIVVNRDYCTANPHIYAMGKHVKIDAEINHQYKYISAMEGAERLIYNLGLSNVEYNMEEKFSKASYFQAQLPFNYYLAKVIVPKRYLANHLPNEYGVAMTTYLNGEFCRVRLNQHDIVEEILVVTLKRIKFDFLQCFVGNHESFLNNLKSKWYLKGIQSFLDFFQEPWTELVIHDNITILHEKCKELLSNSVEEVMDMNIERRERSEMMTQKVNERGIARKMEEAFLDYVRRYRHDFTYPIALPEDFPSPFG